MTRLFSVLSLPVFLAPVTACTGDDKDGDTGDCSGPHVEWVDGECQPISDSDTDTDTDTDIPEDIAIAGLWFSSSMSHTITNTTWVDAAGPPVATTYTFDMTTYDNDGQYAIAQNDSDNSYGPGLWSRFDWTWDAEGQLWTCLTVYDAATEAEALDTPAADDSDPSSDGCRGYIWTALTESH